MCKKTFQKDKGKMAGQDRTERLKAALKVNMQRRKQQSAARLAEQAQETKYRDG